ncbi:MAG: ABC transporter ATP-binding protein, partial [Actinomycetaceae bacterium]
RYLLERITDHQVAVIDSSVRDLPGGVEEYLALRRAQDAPTTSPADQVAAPAVPDAAVAREARKALARIERRLNKLSDQIARLDAQMADAAMDGDHARTASLAAQADQLRAEVDDLEGEWLMAAEDAGA